MGGYLIVGLFLNEGEACGAWFTLYYDCAGGYVIVDFLSTQRAS
jgi:hypothetical protein